MTAGIRSSATRILAFTSTLLLLWLALRFPGHPSEFSLEHFLRWPLELPIVLLALGLWPRSRSSAWLRATLVSFLSLLLLLRLADIGSRLAFGRAFSPLAELHLIGQGWTLASQTVGKSEALLLIVATLALIGLSGFILYRGLGIADGFSKKSSQRMSTLAALLAIPGLLLGSYSKTNEFQGLVTFDVTSELIERVHKARKSVADQSEFAQALAIDPISTSSPPEFQALQGLDVIILFVESYGRSYIDDDYYRTRAHTALARIAAQLESSGLHSRSAWVDSPVKGGRSWLPQATIASGLRLSNHARFDRLISSDRKSLHALFRDAGWTTAAVLPIVKNHWVEGAWYDVDQFYDGPSLQYQGKGFGYVTMPDQYTMHAFQSLIRSKADRPLMASIGLLGSHAPWTPLALPVPWEEVGDGSIFNGSHREGGPLHWSDPEPVREAYGRSVELTMDRIAEYLQLNADDALFMIIGDHQPAGVIAGYRSNAHVPVHFVSNNKAILERLPALNFSEGMHPLADAPVISMEEMRQMFATVFEGALSDIDTALRQ